MRNNRVIFRIILPAILCSALVYISGGNLWLCPLILGLAIGVANWGFHKYNPFLGSLFSILLSYLVFSISLFGFRYEVHFLKFLLHDVLLGRDMPISDFVFLITTFVIAPVLMYVFYRLLFKIPKRKLTLLIIIFSVAILLFVGIIPFDNEEFNIMSNFSVWHITIWQLIVVISLQFMIHQKVVYKINNSKKGGR